MTTKLSVMVARWMNHGRMYSNPGISKIITILLQSYRYEKSFRKVSVNSTQFHVPTIFFLCFIH